MAMLRLVLGLLLLGSIGAVMGCGASHETCTGDACVVGDGGADGGGRIDAGRRDAGTMATDGSVGVDSPIEVDAGSSCVPRPPAVHRPSAGACDRERIRNTIPDPLPDYATCHSHAECDAGENGRCTGNTHDGWYCTYDECFTNDDCTGENMVCNCEGGFRSDNNVCVPGDCQTDADCGADGFCSPTLGDCGHYTGPVGFYCHTCDDECIDDADCGGSGEFANPYCAYSPIVGRWVCQDSECVG